MLICKFIIIISNDIPLLNVDFRKCTVVDYYDIYDTYIADVYNIIQPTIYDLGVSENGAYHPKYGIFVRMDMMNQRMVAGVAYFERYQKRLGGCL